MSGFELPRYPVCAVEEEDDGPGSTRRTWMAALPLVVDDLARRWSLNLGRSFQPGGAMSWVAPARNTAGERLVLKVGWRHDEALHEADGLRAWDGRGAVRLVDALVLGQTNALLLEACEPGTALSQVTPPSEQDVVVAGLLRRLWIQPPADHPFRTLQSMCDWWADEFEAKHLTVPRRLDPGLARTGIDPKLYVGDPTYDLLQYMLNFPDRLGADPAGFAQRMAELLDLDADRLRHWLFARCVQESVDLPHLHDVATKLAP